MEWIIKGMTLIFLMHLSGCAGTRKVSETEEVAGMKPLIEDFTFRKGLSLRGNDSFDPDRGGIIFPFHEKQGDPVWQLAEWGSDFLLSQNDLMVKDGMKTFRNKGKSITFQKSDGITRVQMEVKASEEYIHPRKEGDPWPHLLLEQEFLTKPKLTDMDRFVLIFEGRLMYCDSRMDEDEFDSSLHTAQYQMFLTIQNLNKESAGYGDYLWFGIPFYDDRYIVIPHYAAKDGGKEDATGKFIYSLSSDEFTEKGFHTGEWIRIEKDLKPFIKEAVLYAQDRGYLKSSDLDDFRVSGMNIGWEVPGTFDCGFEFRRLDLRYSDPDL